MLAGLLACLFACLLAGLLAGLYKAADPLPPPTHTHTQHTHKQLRETEAQLAGLCALLGRCVNLSLPSWLVVG